MYIVIRRLANRVSFLRRSASIAALDTKSFFLARPSLMEWNKKAAAAPLRCFDMRSHKAAVRVAKNTSYAFKTCPLSRVSSEPMRRASFVDIWLRPSTLFKARSKKWGKSATHVWRRTLLPAVVLCFRRTETHRPICKKCLLSLSLSLFLFLFLSLSLLAVYNYFSSFRLFS
jgi:hypothetical protein